MTRLHRPGRSHTIKVRLDRAADRSYMIHVKSGLLDEIPGLIAHRWKEQKVFVITDSNVGPRYGRAFSRKLTLAGVDNVMLDFPAGESSKKAPTVARLYAQLLSHGIRRKSLIVALGGGVVGDIAGFVAATVLRGVPFIQVPTSLLAQVDSSVGGKVGIDHRRGKNLIGAFHQPSAVFIDPRVLRSLPLTEFRNGLAEIVKIAAALDRKLFAKLERGAARLRLVRPDVIGPLIAEAAGLKAAVIEKDERESGLRKSLNLGHTIGHALEAASGYSVKHGCAVSIGLALESSIAERMGLLSRKEYERILRLLRSLGLPVTTPPIENRKRFLEALRTDKKAEGEGIRFVLLNGIGSCTIGVDVPSGLLHETMGIAL